MKDVIYVALQNWKYQAVAQCRWNLQFLHPIYGTSLNEIEGYEKYIASISPHTAAD